MYFKLYAPDSLVSPEPIITRQFGYQAKHDFIFGNVEKIRNIVDLLDTNETVSIKDAKKYY